MSTTRCEVLSHTLYAMDDPTNSMTTRDREDDPSGDTTASRALPTVHTPGPEANACAAPASHTLATRRATRQRTLPALGSDAESMSSCARIVTTKLMRILSGKHSAAALRKWADRQGIPTLQGADGPFTTMDALNYALGLGPTNDQPYSPDDVA